MPNNTMVFKHPGPQSVDGVSFDYLIVLDEELDATYADGWSKSPAEAKAAYDATHAPAPDVVVQPGDTVQIEGVTNAIGEPVTFVAPSEVDTAAPTRAELWQKATELGIAFDGRSSDKTLAGKIADALKA